MPSITEQDANAAIARAITALEAVDFHVIRHADDKHVERFIAMLERNPAWARVAMRARPTNA